MGQTSPYRYAPTPIFYSCTCCASSLPNDGCSLVPKSLKVFAPRNSNTNSLTLTHTNLLFDGMFSLSFIAIHLLFLNKLTFSLSFPSSLSLPASLTAFLHFTFSLCLSLHVTMYCMALIVCSEVSYAG